MRGNDLGDWTRPAPGIYPHQWLWDSSFIAIGLATFDPHRAADELRSLARGQWRSGMLPHMIYSRQWPYWMEALLWNTGNFMAHGGVRTSGLTQPPMYAIAAEYVAQALPAEERAEFVCEILPVAMRYHEWIYRARDPSDSGLAACLHSWECGLDDTPYWTVLMDKLPSLPWYWRWLREYRRVNPQERATDHNVRHMLTLAKLNKHYYYDSAKIIKHSPIVLQDLVFNAVLAAANESLERLAESVGGSVPAPLRAHFAPTRRALEQLWDARYEAYFSRDMHSGNLVTEPSIVTFMALFGGTASPARAKVLRDQLKAGGFNTPYGVPSVPTTSPHFEPQRYWRGPVWINTNWFIIKGLERYGFTKEAAELRHNTLELVRKSGFREYFNPLTGEGLGAKHFSWTAALTLELLAHPTD